MSKYFKSVTSYQDLKDQYRKLLKENHPDNGGDLEKMQEINVEYDAMFKIWKDRAAVANNLSEEEKTETARSTRRHFYSAYGWEGSRYDVNLTLKEIAKIVRAYVREKYPTCKFSIRTHYASMCQSLSVDLLEFPERMYKTAAELKENYYVKNTYTDKDGKTQSYKAISEEVNEMWRKLNRNNIFTLDSWTDDDLLKCYEKVVFEENRSFFGVQTEYFKSVIDDVNAFVASYNYDDSDSMTDYFDVNFYDGKVDFSNCKHVPKVARIKKQNTAPAAKENKKESSTAEIETSGKSYTVEESQHTKTGEKIYLVKWFDTLSRESYKELAVQIKKIGGYYSKFTHSFIFKTDPSEALKGVKIA
jgi:hypothetical protein